MKKKELSKLSFDGLEQAIGVAEGNSIIVRLNNKAVLKDKYPAGMPYVMTNTHIAVVVCGEMDITVNFQPIHLQQGMVVVVNYGCIYSVVRHSDDFEMHTLVVADNFASTIFGVDSHQKVCAEGEFLLVQTGDADLQILTDMLRIVDCLNSNFTQNKSVLRLQLCAFCSYIEQLTETSNSLQSTTPADRQHIIATQFLSLLRNHIGRERHLSFYADKLCLTQSYLSAVVSQASGFPPKHWIERKLLMRIKQQLLHTEKSIGEISDDLYFSNVSFFCKYFKRLTGLSPSDYRRK